MGFRNDTYASIYTAKRNGKAYSCKILIGHTDKTSNEYVFEFSSFVNFAGDAANKVAELGLPEEQDRNNPIKRKIKLLRTDVSSYFNNDYYAKLLRLADGNEELTKFVKANADKKTFTVWDFELAEDGASKNAAITAAKGERNNSAKKSAPENNSYAVADTGDEELPF